MDWGHFNFTNNTITYYKQNNILNAHFFVKNITKNLHLSIYLSILRPVSRISVVVRVKKPPFFWLLLEELIIFAKDTRLKDAN